MRFFIVTMSHPEGDGWNWHLAAGTTSIKDLVAVGSSRHLPERAVSSAPDGDQ
jgi:hypothetical protein